MDSTTAGAKEASTHLLLAGPGLGLVACFGGMATLGNLRQETIPFLLLYGVAFVLYIPGAWWSLQWRGGRGALGFVLGVAVVLRLVLLFTTPPALSDDVYRYMWDGHLANAGVSPYAQPVKSPLLDVYDTPQRALVNNDWMASPYLPVSQVFFALVYRIAPNSTLAFQVAAALLDLLTGLLILDLLRRLGLPAARVLIYLWNPLVVVEFAHGAHVDALMICLTMVALWALVAFRARLLAVIALAAATLTKGLPALLLPVLARRWGWRYTLIYAVLVFIACAVLALGPGWGLVGPLEGKGLLGALRIYGAYWNYNSGLYHWLEVTLSGYRTPGAVPPEAAGWGPIWAAKFIVMGLLVAVLVIVWRKSHRAGNNLALLRLAAVPLAAYVLLATTVHPWYATLVMPFLPFLPSRNTTGRSKFLWPALYFSGAVALSYLTYLDPANPREYDIVRLLEYAPTYLLLIWAAWPPGGTGGGGRSEKD
jgi:hypothetical protein